MKFSEAKLYRMNSYSRQYQDQFNRILYGNSRLEDKSIFKEVMDANKESKSQERRIRRAMWRRMEQG